MCDPVLTLSNMQVKSPPSESNNIQRDDALNREDTMMIVSLNNPIGVPQGSDLNINQ